MNGFYSIIYAKIKTKYGDLIPVAIVFYDMTKQKTYTKTIVNTKHAYDLRMLLFSIKRCQNISSLVKIQIEISLQDNFFMYELMPCKTLSRPGRTMDRILKENFKEKHI